MTKHKDEEPVDALELKRRAQARIHAEIKGLSHEEEIEYFRRSVDEGPLGEWWKALEKRTQEVREKDPPCGAL